MNKKLIFVAISVCLIVVVMQCSASNLFDGGKTYGIQGAQYILDENFVVFSTIGYNTEKIDLIIVYTNPSMFSSVEEFESNFEEILSGISTLAKKDGYEVGIIKATAFINGINRNAHWVFMGDKPFFRFETAKTFNPDEYIQPYSPQILGEERASIHTLASTMDEEDSVLSRIYDAYRKEQNNDY